VSAPTVQTLAAAAVADGLADEAIVRLANCGTAGQHPQNIGRDVLRHFGADVQVPPLYNVRVPARNRAGETIEVDTPVLLPHQLLSHVAHSSAELWTELKMQNTLESFWDSCLAAGDPALHGHPVLGIPGWKSKTLPLLVYGDGGAFSRNDSLEVVSMAVLGNRGPTWKTRFVLTGWVSSAQVKGAGGTWDVLWEVLGVVNKSLCFCFNGIIVIGA
jgi:hypothetical protein